MTRNTSNYKLDTDIIKKTNKLLNRMHKNMPYNDKFLPIYDSSVIRMLRFQLELVKYGKMYILLEAKNNNTPYMVIPPMNINGDFPNEIDILSSMSYLYNRIQREKYRGTVVYLESVPTECAIQYKSPHIIRKPVSKDLIFSIDEQANLPGSKFRKTRNKINNFKKNNIFNIIDMENFDIKNNITEMMDMSKNTIKEVSRDYELREFLLNYNTIQKFMKELDGFVIIDNNEKILGYEIHHKVKHTNTMIGVIKRSLHECIGISSYIEQQTAIRMLDKFPNLKFINNSANSRGKSGEFKKSMHPIKYVYASNLELKERVV